MQAIFQLFKKKPAKKLPVELLLGFSIKKNGPIKRALRHSSYAGKINNERLEFLGDSILSAVVSEYYFNRHNEYNEGMLSIARDRIISRQNLNILGTKLLDNVELKHKTNGITKKMYGDFLEALIGGVFLEKGYKEAQEFIVKNIINENLGVEPKIIDYKGILINKLKNENKKVNFERISEKGPDHEKKHKVGLVIDGKTQLTCWSKTIKEAEHKLSKALFKNLYENNTHSNRIN